MKNKKQVNIKCIGLGGAGSSIIQHMLSENVQGVDLIIADIDMQTIDSSLVKKKIIFDAKRAKGVANMNPSIAKETARESADELRLAFEEADIVFIVTGLGGETGTGVSSVVAKIAREAGALTLAVVSKPFKPEGLLRVVLAEEGVKDLKEACDGVIVIDNNRLLSLIDKGMSMSECFTIVDSAIAQVVEGISKLIRNQENDINIELCDLQVVLQHRGIAYVGRGEFQGANAAYEALNAALTTPLSGIVSIEGARGILVLFSMHPEYSQMALTEAMEIIHESVDDEADVIFGTTSDPEMPIDKVGISLIATGFESEPEKSANNPGYEPIY